MAGKLAMIFSFLFVLLCWCSTTAEAMAVDSLPEDDEDIGTSASFSLNLRISIECSRQNWYTSNISMFLNLLRFEIASGINTDCSECGFSSDYLANEAISCQNDDVFYQAIIQNWHLQEYPENTLLELIENRYNSSTSFNISNSGFGTFEDEYFELFPESVSVTFIQSMGSGYGSGATSEDSDTTTDSESPDKTTTKSVETDLVISGAGRIKGVPVLFTLMTVSLLCYIA